MARHPTMRIADGRWQLEGLATRGGQSYRVKDLHRLPPAGSTGMATPKTLVATTGEVRDLLGVAFTDLVEVRDQRSNGGQ